MSAFRMTRLGAIAPITLVLALFPSLARAEAAENEDDTLPPAVASSDAAPATDPTPAPAEAAAVAAPAAAPAAEAAAPAAAKDDAAADAAAAAAAEEAASSRPSNEEVDQFKLNLYGFTDFTYSTQVGHSFDLGSPYSSFAVGKLNLYAAAELGDNWRSLAEIRFMYLPNGTNPASTTFPAPPRTDTTVGDYTDLGRPVKWGGISIERAWLEHTFHPALTVRAGAFLTPYGIWNVDHGSPVIIGARRPFIIGESLFPEHQTGLEVYGAWNFGPSQVGYHLTLSNGRGPIDSYQDLDHNKAIGWRAFFKHENKDFGSITVGTSGYKGTYTDSTDAYASDPITGKLVVTHPISAQYKELSLAADLKWELGGALVQSEVIMNDVAYPDDHRPAMYSTSGPPGFAPDHRRVGVYGLAGYRFPFLGIMPFAGAEYYDVGLYSFTPPSAAFWGGLNVRPTARVVLKAQYTYSWFSKWEGPDYGHYNGIDLQAAWSF
ncbi:MAG TPA: hypothetical protein VER96_05280 [Polyangiaceae bacterium]|nr:hypothetical protein [Polyangiaceae bacterium]